ncbi:hypothetical protein BB559_007180 [Furculomyces boomerangus]|uniref:Cyclin N-terminal domain-containing protein n=1 Tax=Furculomyces boomerangus TaxID=61424 RepID=A0A2T9XYL9_9FUNG|nr:hypothetical protein BB559_007180 [Furculomyces boomerangus]
MISTSKVYKSINNYFPFIGDQKAKKPLPPMSHEEEKKIMNDQITDVLEALVTELFISTNNSAFTKVENNERNLPSLKRFIKEIVYKTRTPTTCMALAALYLTRVKANNTNLFGTGSSLYRLILASLMVSTKYLYDDAFHNISWFQVVSGIFSLQQINQMELEFMHLLKYDMYIDYNKWNQWIATLEAKLVDSWRKKHTEQYFYQNKLFLAYECCHQSAASIVSNIAWSSSGTKLLVALYKTVNCEIQEPKFSVIKGKKNLTNSNSSLTDIKNNSSKETDTQTQKTTQRITLKTNTETKDEGKNIINGGKRHSSLQKFANYNNQHKPNSKSPDKIQGFNNKLNTRKPRDSLITRATKVIQNSRIFSSQGYEYLDSDIPDTNVNYGYKNTNQAIFHHNVNINSSSSTESLKDHNDSQTKNLQSNNPFSIPLAYPNYYYKSHEKLQVLTPEYNNNRKIDSEIIKSPNYNFGQSNLDTKHENNEEIKSNYYSIDTHFSSFSINISPSISETSSFCKSLLSSPPEINYSDRYITSIAISSSSDSSPFLSTRSEDSFYNHESNFKHSPLSHNIKPKEIDENFHNEYQQNSELFDGFDTKEKRTQELSASPIRPDSNISNYFDFYYPSSNSLKSKDLEITKDVVILQKVEILSIDRNDLRFPKVINAVDYKKSKNPALKAL